MTRAEILDEAKGIVTGKRDEQYGHPEDNFALIATLWTAYTREKYAYADRLFPKDVANMMIMLKIARELTGSGKLDNYIDIAGYAACGGELTNGTD